MSFPRFSAWAVPGIPEVQAGDDLVALILDAVARQAGTEPDLALAEGDILVIASKIVAKAEGMLVPATDREKVIADDTVRVVAERVTPNGITRIVETRQGLIMAAAGIDMSNVPDGYALRLPEDPDLSARTLCAALRERLGIALGIIVTDTFGRPWRVGQTDVAIGAAGVQLTEDLRGSTDANGRPLHATIAVLADEIAGAADLVKGKAGGLPVAVVRGLGHLVVAVDAPGARTLVRPLEEDMFRFGSAEAYQLGYDTARAELGGAPAKKRGARQES
ncbi:coenzyme F420-0:L-glutamate ligase [Devosia sp. CN2-171]|uniref:coenzyme F420-0:L-glutamate ligase n=1 Tax=Devosia sp. CN2-171 TaxID=3400909 RepID=UPI003BF8BA69